MSAKTETLDIGRYIPFRNAFFFFYFSTPILSSKYYQLAFFIITDQS